MKLEVLISTLNGNPRELVKKMHLDSDAIIVNQCNKNSEEQFQYKDHTILVYNTTDRGIGKSRNLALEKSTADIILFADDDEIFVQNYRKSILKVFEKNKKIDFAIFDIKSHGDSRRSRKPITKFIRARWWNSLSYGATRFAVKRESVQERNIQFSPDFGNKEKYAHGEDNVFLHDCIMSKLVTFTIPFVIATVSDSQSTWFNGYDEKYYYDTGAIFGAIFSIRAFFFAPIFFLKKRLGPKKCKAFTMGILAFNNITVPQLLTDIVITSAFIFFLHAYCIGNLNLAIKTYYPIICLTIFCILAIINCKKIEIKYFVLIETIQLFWVILCIFITNTGIGSAIQMISLTSLFLLIPYIKPSQYLITITKYIIPPFLILFFFSDQSHLNTNFIGFIYLASYVITILSYNLYRKDMIIVRLFVTIFFTILIFLSKSRASLIGVAIFYLSLLVSTKKWNQEKIKKITPYILTIGSVIFVIVYVLIWKTGFNLNFRFFVNKGLFSGRNRIWNEMLPLIIKNPLFGTGSKYVLQSFPTYAMHNTILMIVCTFGIPNLCLFIAILRYTICKQTNNDINHKKAKLFLAVLFTFFIVDFFESYIYWTNYSFIIFVIFMLVNSLVFSSKKNEVLLIEEGIDRVGGVEKIMSILANHLYKTKNVTVISFDKTSSRPFFKYDNNINIHYLRYRYKQKSKQMPKKNIIYYLYRIKEIIFDDSVLQHKLGRILYNTSQNTTVICGRLEVGIKVAKIIEDEKLIVRDAIFYDYYNILRKKQIKHSCHYINTLIVSSEESKKCYQKHLAHYPTKITKIYNPLGSDYEKTSQRVKKSKLILAVGRASEQKNFSILIKAFNNISLKYPDWKLNIIGPKVTETYHDYSSKNIILQNETQDMAAKYQQAAFYVMTSRYEGYANSLVEAMACGTASISFNWLMGANEIIPNPKTGILIPLQNRKLYAEGKNSAEDLELLTNTLEYLIKSPTLRDKLGKNAKQYIRSTRQNEIILKQWDDIINNG